MFYEKWSEYFEEVGNFQRAEAVLKSGLERRAEPLEEMQKKFKSETLTKMFNFNFFFTFFLF